MKGLIPLFSVTLLLGCNDSTPPSTAQTQSRLAVSDVAVHAENRWYSAEQVKEGRALFRQYCAVCHGMKAEATPNWKTPDASGNYPPPPLNGSAHAWHHPLSVLDAVIRDGGKPVGGVMPAWGAVLNEAQRTAVIASFQDYWSDEIYQLWLERDPDF